MYSGPVPQPIRSASTCGLTVTSVRPLAWLSLTAHRSCIAVLLAFNRSAIFSLPLFGYMTSLTSLHTPVLRQDVHTKYQQLPNGSGSTCSRRMSSLQSLTTPSLVH